MLLSLCHVASQQKQLHSLPFPWWYPHVVSAQAWSEDWQAARGIQDPNSGVCVKGLAVGESDELLGDTDPEEMDVKWLHSPLVKIANAIENKSTVYKVSLCILTVAISCTGFWEAVTSFCVSPRVVRSEWLTQFLWTCECLTWCVLCQTVTCLSSYPSPGSSP